MPHRFLCLTTLAVLSLPLAAAPGHYPEWARDVTWYQIFPERFANGDPSNDPTRDSLISPQYTHPDWQVMPWTADWYARADWEKASSPDFYHTVFQRRYGGDLQGVIDRLDFLADLGVTGLYFNPLFYADSLHKYDGNTFHHIDPHFGPDPEGDLAIIEAETSNPATWQWTAADRLFLELLQAAKKRNMRVIIDGVWNHTGRDFFAFRDVRERHRKSRFADWYDIIEFDDPRTAHNEFDYHGWFGYKSLPEFANDPTGDNLARGPKRYIFHATRRWMDPNGDGDPSDGIDGWRLDVAEEVPTGFWREWHALVREINPEAYTVAEIWGPSGDYVRHNHFGAAMNYRGFAIPLKGWLIDGRISASDFLQRLAAEREARPPEAAAVLQNLVDSHDTQRVASMIANRASWPDYLNADWFDYDDSARVSARSEGYTIDPPCADGRRIWKMLALFQATYVGAPMIYYGTEAGMWGADDPDDRMPTWWPEMEIDLLVYRPDGSQRETPVAAGFDAGIHQAYRTVLQLRQAHPALRRGSFEILESRDDSNFIAFQRRLGDDRFVALFNRGDGSVVPPGEALKGLELLYQTDPAATDRSLPPLSAALFGPRPAGPEPGQ